MSRDVARELRRLGFKSGGAGIFILCPRRTPVIASTAACEARVRAAGRLGFGASWGGVAKALEYWALGDVITEAIEEQEARR